MSAWRVYANWAIGGTALLVCAVLFLTAAGDPASAWGLFFMTYYFVTLSVLLGFVLLLISAMRVARRRLANRFAKP